MEKVRLGIIGFGAQGSTYAEFINSGKVENIVIGGICDIDPAKKVQVQQLYPNVPYFDSYQSLIKSGEVDAIVTTVPHYLHTEIGKYALTHEVHALLEKPADIYASKVQEITDLAQTKPHLTFGIFFNQRTNPLYQKVKSLIDTGVIGNIRRTNWIITTWWRPQAYYDQSAWRATWSQEGGGVLVNQAPHQIDLLQWLCGLPKKVYSNIKYGYQRKLNVDDDITTVLDYGNGATGVFITCTHDVIGTDRLEITGDKGKILVEDSSKLTLTRLNESETSMNNKMNWSEAQEIFKGKALDDIYSRETFEFNSIWGEQHINVLNNFAANIIDGTPLIAPGSDGINGVNLVNAFYLSSWLGREVTLPVDSQQFELELNKQITTEKNE
ncbi:Gfo/Idh/MocA family protein [Staphylococcus gallinarum]|uniref:Gfo/Idh/MocA family protein n=1 Tax=Staphylococcus gallinarum TaxID=1293 RepID=UPI000D1CC59D|nr:Gfo/Idh/MocA family oxidoreductase [Staphylococcus gallinarum]MCD8792965.1 Gfo/Idh/MocA family oxidoreductase [Staphylococcus gallinarum]PTE31252.1 gfo/Idh/MocA family oxidoreductase [Staphylococcus gallinarum]PTK88599.1 gfo/Idh/MocA family oxidoreductase [Staphylococcus gallinarum]RIL18551.1 gfo/Idh/MocA family oxidoreductase [Staphylococcus gallinarum]RIL22957.1 gfo/Idh/MocA family oxidoreductase [Staphylococcus gallinarum]